jgi:hypothetical protein
MGVERTHQHVNTPGGVFFYNRVALEDVIRCGMLWETSELSGLMVGDY